jgi:hypothetical protein
MKVRQTLKKYIAGQGASALAEETSIWIYQGFLPVWFPLRASLAPKSSSVAMGAAHGSNQVCPVEFAPEQLPAHKPDANKPILTCTSAAKLKGRATKKQNVHCTNMKHCPDYLFHMISEHNKPKISDDALPFDKSVLLDHMTEEDIISLIQTSTTCRFEVEDWNDVQTLKLQQNLTTRITQPPNLASPLKQEVDTTTTALAPP